ncbi:Dynein regulatory complex protein 8 [Allomyces arbusculus]|nr:Dynein regulatory complex protein 8 [Allomyces arbusculus]
MSDVPNATDATSSSAPDAAATTGGTHDQPPQATASPAEMQESVAADLSRAPAAPDQGAAPADATAASSAPVDAPPAGSNAGGAVPASAPAPGTASSAPAGAAATVPATATLAAAPMTDVHRRLFAKTKNLFSVFDKSRSGTCDIREAGTLLRAMGVYPTEAKLKDIVMQILDPVQPTVMTLDQFLRVAWPLIAAQADPRDSDDVLYRAFLTLDKDQRGYLDVETIKQMLSTMGEPMTAEELEEMVSSIGVKDGKFFYEDYLALMD